MKTKIMTTLALVTALALTGCGPESGTITHKDSREGYYSTRMQCASYNQQGACTVNIPVRDWNPPAWSFHLENGEDKGWRSVSESTWHAHEVGDFYEVPK